jgi:quinol-cytochrome oxidoreductase complex cytochrome b subunit
MTVVEQAPGRSDAVARVQSVVLAVLSVEVALLAVTGVILYFVYRPRASEALIQVTGGDRPMGFPDWTRLLHRWIAILTVPTALVAGLLFSVRLAMRGRWQGPAAAAGLLVASLAALITGFRLPWKQLALWAVTGGEIHIGYGSLLDGDVRFVLTDRGEEAPSTLITWLVVHALLGAFVGALVAVACRLTRAGAESEPVPPQGALAAGGTHPRRWEQRR